ncbi:DUF7674 family protein [Novipirellula sp. SH528]|uniref:DUF7674 family protein n=1 Tax=Novipirellula sp. SH528 TaxID=3454466 RepID=UPI003F9FC895
MTFRTTFLEWALRQFPELSLDFEGESTKTRLHFAFLAFRKHTQAAIDDHDRQRVLELFEMADRVLDWGYPEMRSLFHVVYVEDLRFHDERTPRSWALQLLTPSLKRERAQSISGSPDTSA